MYNWEYIYSGDIYRKRKGKEKDTLVEKNASIAYLEDDKAWVRIDDMLEYAYTIEFLAKRDSEEYREENKEIEKKAALKFESTFMPRKDIKEGDLYVEPLSIEVILTPDDIKSSKTKETKKKRG